ncbi:threonyl-tRNA synthetase [Psychromicrobium silvestre]|uniref:Threonine--tRNA ligase n=1 Tax=Psychromicrobium silvestre TaxID=1645614 RepID=A0A7Y9LSG9_9MICC|nr:threonine--tRNA ligase [Psychromicrobium silvestre]NYE94782.1 threonyl-tRNA synthetase [Psychromicrobium silvestre]
MNIDQSVKVDHRELGRELDLFASHPLVGPGLPLWLPDGAVIRAELEKLAFEESLRSGCQRVYSPVLAKRELYERSGHWQKFSEDMFPAMRIGTEELVLRPANCPHHAMIYASRPHSWRELPLRYAELGSMFRSELSGVLSGLSRVRQINLDDCHVFATPDQAHGEVLRALRAIQRGYAVLGLEVDYYRLSARGSGAGFIGSDQQWADAEDVLEAALQELGLPYRKVSGEAAFYGPKIDVQLFDAAGREETISTVQFDFNQPERFGLEYIADDGAAHRPLMIHRGLFGAMERMVALLIEKYQGQLPPWLAPLQLSVLPIGEGQEAAAESLVDELRARGLRVQLESQGSLGSRVRKARQQRVPWIAVVGEREAQAGTLSLSVPRLGEQRELGLLEFIEAAERDLRSRSSSAAL